MFVLLIMLIAGPIRAHDPLENTCIGDDNLYFDHRCYTMAMQELSFYQAHKYCRKLGGARRSHLAYITSSTLVEKITEKWPTLFPQQNTSTAEGGLRIGAGIQNRSHKYPQNSIEELHGVVWYSRWHAGIELYEKVLANQTYLMQMLRSASDTVRQRKQACILLERSQSSPQYTWFDAHCSRLSTAVLCERSENCYADFGLLHEISSDNLHRRFKKVAVGKKLLNFFENGPVESYHVCIEKCSTNVMCQAFSVRRTNVDVQCRLSATKMIDNGIIDEPEFEIWESI